MKKGDIPLDSKPSDPRLLRQDVPPNLLDHGLGGWVLRQRIIRVLVVDVVAHAHELAAFIRASEQDDSDAQDLGARDIGRVGRIGFEDEFVRANGDGADV